MIHLQTSDHTEAVVNVAEQGTSQKWPKCKSFQVKTTLFNAAKITKADIGLGLRQQ